MTAHRIQNRSWGEVEQMNNEFIRMLRLDSEPIKNISREVTYVPGDNHIRASPNCGGEHMPVVRIRQPKTGVPKGGAIKLGFLRAGEDGGVLAARVDEKPEDGGSGGGGDAQQ